MNAIRIFKGPTSQYKYAYTIKGPTQSFSLPVSSDNEYIELMELKIKNLKEEIKLLKYLLHGRKK